MSNNPEDILKDPDQIKQLISILSSLLPKEDEETKTKPRKKRVLKKKTTKTTSNRKNVASTAKKATNARVISLWICQKIKCLRKAQKLLKNYISNHP